MLTVPLTIEKIIPKISKATVKVGLYCFEHSSLILNKLPNA